MAETTIGVATKEHKERKGIPARDRQNALALDAGVCEKKTSVSSNPTDS